MGGDSSEREISLKSGRAVLKALGTLGIEAIPIGIEGDIVVGLDSVRIDIAFIVLHGRFGEDGQVQEFLEARGIPYTGSGVEASRLAMDKVKSRERFREAGLEVPPTVVLARGDPVPAPPFPFPVVVKPSREGSSIGLSRAAAPAELASACRTAFAFDDTILIEPFLKGTEVTAGILGDTALPLVEIVPSNPFFDFEAKYTKGKTDFVVPARLADPVAARAQAAGLAAHRALGCRAYSRVDLIVSPGGKIYLLEVNTIPGFTETSLFPMASAAAGIPFPELCLRLLRLARRGGGGAG